jgi:hypothetical protein
MEDLTQSTILRRHYPVASRLCFLQDCKHPSAWDSYRSQIFARQTVYERKTVAAAGGDLNAPIFSRCETNNHNRNRHNT